MASLFSTVAWFWRVLFLGLIGYTSYTIRLHSVNTFGKVIHEFDPYFNFWATEYGQ